MHPRRRLLQALVDHELSADQASRVLTHTSTCARCAARLDRVRSLASAFRMAVLDIDALAPAAREADGVQNREARQTVARSQAGRLHANTAVTPLRPIAGSPATAGSAGRDARGRPAPFRAPLRWAAIFVVGSAAVAAAALIVQRATSPDAPLTPTVDAVSAPPPAAAPDIAGAVRVQPVDGEVVITITGAGEGSQLFVEFGAEAGVLVQIEGDLTPRFIPRDGAVDVPLAGAQANVRVLLPASLRTAVVRTGDRVLARVREGRIEPAAAAAGLPIGQAP